MSRPTYIVGLGMAIKKAGDPGKESGLFIMSNPNEPD
jgi:hypothetical protein